VVVDLMEPCSATSARIGYATSTCIRADTSQARTSGRSSSSMGTNGHSCERSPPATGVGIAWVSLVRRNSTGAEVPTSHSPPCMWITW
jgi:hypothetical protein